MIGRNGVDRSAIRNGAKSGIVDELPAVDPQTGMLPRKWTAKIGSGYAGPAVADGRVFVSDRIADKNLERVLCFDSETGKELWKHEYEARYTISYPLGPRATPTVDGNRVYTLGAMGHLFCFDAATGHIFGRRICRPTSAQRSPHGDWPGRRLLMAINSSCWLAERPAQWS